MFAAMLWDMFAAMFRHVCSHVYDMFAAMLWLKFPDMLWHVIWRGCGVS